MNQTEERAHGVRAGIANAIEIDEDCPKKRCKPETGAASRNSVAALGQFHSGKSAFPENGRFQKY
jgi:hypothetical protein